MKYCSYCSSALDDDAKYCTNCGAKVTFVKSESTAQTNSDSEKSTESNSSANSETKTSTASTLGTLFGIGVASHVVGSLLRPRPPRPGPAPRPAPRPSPRPGPGPRPGGPGSPRGRR